MRWPWQKRERRDSGGDFSDAVVRLIEAQAAGSAADASLTAAVEAAAGALSRAFAAARVEGPAHVLEAVTPGFLAQVGRDLIRSGDSMHVIDVDRMGRVTLLPCSSWHFEGGRAPEDLDRPGDLLRAEHFHDPAPSLRRRCVRPLGEHPGAALRGDRADLLGAHNGPSRERDRAFPRR